MCLPWTMYRPTEREFADGKARKPVSLGARGRSAASPRFYGWLGSRLKSRDGFS